VVIRQIAKRVDTAELKMDIIALLAGVVRPDRILVLSRNMIEEMTELRR
jgi:hypothetical protein